MTINMETLEKRPVKSRRDAEAEARRGVDKDGVKRLRSDKVGQFLYRCTAEKKEQLIRLANALNAGKTHGRTTSYTDTIDIALDTLEEKLKGGAE